MTRPLSILTAALLIALAPAARADDKLPANVVKLEAHPAKVALKTPYEYAQLLVTATLKDGDKVDVTRLAKFAAPAAVKVGAAGQVRPAADGTGELTVTLEGHSVKVPVEVSGQKANYEVSFVRDVMPLLSRL